MSTPASDDFVDSVLANLKVIAMLNKNQKLCVRKGALSVDTQDMMQPVRRWLHNDSRDIILLHVRNTITSCVRIATSCIQFAERDGCNRNVVWTLESLRDAMVASENGMCNLQSTYVQDAMLVASMTVLLQRMKACVEDVTTFIDKKVF